MKTALVAVALLSLAAPAIARSYPTIVGEWYPEGSPQYCGGPGATHIEPMGWVEDEYSCSFTDVARDGWKVTWHGTCSGGGDGERTKVVAVERSGRLSVSFNGNPGAYVLRRCNAKASMSMPAPTEERIALHYLAYPGDTELARRYAPDAVDAISQVDGAQRLAERLTVFVAKAGGYTFVEEHSMFSCGTGAHGCPLHVYKGDVEVSQFSACEDTSNHALSSDGSRFFDCFNEDDGRPVVGN